jgi:hypothetical protein
MTFMKLPLIVGLVAVGAVACAPSAKVPSDVIVHRLSADELILRGTASPTLAGATCTADAPAKPANAFALSEDTHASILLLPAPGEPALPLTMLHVTNLDTNRTWCVMTQADGTPAALAADLPSGLYAVSVASTNRAAARRYEVKVERL